VTFFSPAWLFAAESTQWFAKGLGIIGVVFGLLWGAARAYPKPPSHRIRLIWGPLFFAFFSGLVCFILIDVVEGSPAKMYEFFRPVHTFMVTFSRTTEFLISMFYGSTLGGAVAVMMHLSPKGTSQPAGNQESGE
jgi:hypothetical protein